MNEELKKEFYEKFVEKIRNGDEYDGDYLTDDPEEVLQWIEDNFISKKSIINKIDNRYKLCESSKDDNEITVITKAAGSRILTELKKELIKEQL